MNNIADKLKLQKQQHTGCKNLLLDSNMHSFIVSNELKALV